MESSDDECYDWRATCTSRAGRPGRCREDDEEGEQVRINNNCRSLARQTRRHIIPLSSSDTESEPEANSKFDFQTSPVQMQGGRYQQRKGLNDATCNNQQENKDRTGYSTCSPVEGSIPFMASQKQHHLKRPRSRQRSWDVNKRMKHDMGQRSPRQGDSRLYDECKRGHNRITNLRLTLDVNVNNVNINVEPMYGVEGRTDLDVPSPMNRKMAASPVDEVIEISSSSDESVSHEPTNKPEPFHDSDVICLDSDSGDSRMGLPICNPYVMDDHRKDFEDKSDTYSDSSELPEIPLLEPMPGTSEQHSLNETMVSYVDDVKDSVVVKSEDDQERSRHSSGELEEVLEKPTDACWITLISAPEHLKVSNQSVKRQRHNHSISHYFSGDKHNVISACQEEGFTKAAVEMVTKFTTTAHRPLPQCLQSLFHECLKTHCTSSSNACLIFKCLKDIQHLHHPGSRDFPISWMHLKSVVEVLLQDARRLHQDGSGPSVLEWHVNLLALQYLVTVLEDDLERKTKWNTLRNSYVHSLLNPETCRTECKEVMEWLHCLVVDHASNHSDSCWCAEGTCHRNYVPSLLEKLLQLSLRLTTMWNYKEYLQKMAEELSSSRMFGLPQVQLMFDTIKHDHLHLKLSELLFNSCFECDILGDNSGRREAISISRIVDEYFFYVPKQGTDKNPLRRAVCKAGSSFMIQEDEDEEEREVEEGRRRVLSMEEMAEVMVYLLLVMLQSYLKCMDGLQCSLKPEASKKSNYPAFLPFRRLSEEDQIYLIQMGDHVDRLRAHVTALCQGRLTLRLRVWLDQMSILYDWL